MATRTEGERARQAASDAGQWHQGSGNHADQCADRAEWHEGQADNGRGDEQKHRAAAKAWREAAEAEAKYLRERKGRWGSQAKWEASEAGRATERANNASREADDDE